MEDMRGQLQRLEIEVRQLKMQVAKLVGGPGVAKAPMNLGDITSEYNDFVVRKDPPNWRKQGLPSFEGRRLSQTTPEFLDALAQFLDWRAGKEEEENATYTSKKTGQQEPKSPWTRKDAARARAWAERLREGGAAVRLPPPPAPLSEGEAEELPF